MIMRRYKSKERLIAAYAIKCRKDGIERIQAQMIAQNKPRYAPHLYRGGWVIPGFGYSIERIAHYVAQERAGNPYLV